MDSAALDDLIRFFDDFLFFSKKDFRDARELSLSLSLPSLLVMLVEGLQRGLAHEDTTPSELLVAVLQLELS